MGSVPWVACRWERQAEIRAADREFVRLVLAEQDRASVAQPHPAVRVLVRHVILVTARARGGAYTAGLVDVLEADRDAVQGAARAACSELAGGGARRIAQDSYVAVQFAVERVDPFEIGLGQRHRGEPAVRNRAARLGDGQESRVRRHAQPLG